MSSIGAEPKSIDSASPPAGGEAGQAKDNSTLKLRIARRDRSFCCLIAQLNDQFLICQNYAKYFSGLAVRIISKIMALTIL